MHTRPGGEQKGKTEIINYDSIFINTKPKHLQGLVKDMPSTWPQKKYGVDELSGLKMQPFNVTQTARPFLMSYVFEVD